MLAEDTQFVGRTREILEEMTWNHPNKGRFIINVTSGAIPRTKVQFVYTINQRPEN